MKRFLFAITIVSVSAFAQIKLEKNEVDEFTGTVVKVTEVVNIGKGQACV